MLRMDNANVNFNGASVIEDAIVANLSASYSGQEVYFNMTIVDLDVYNGNKEIVELDFDNFKDKALESINSIVL